MLLLDLSLAYCPLELAAILRATAPAAVTVPDNADAALTSLRRDRAAGPVSPWRSRSMRIA